MTNINIIKDLVKDVSIKHKVKTADTNTVDFKNVLQKKKLESNKNENSSNKSDVKINSDNIDKATKDIKPKVENIKQYLEDNNEEEVIEEVVYILNLLNINVVKQDILPIIVELPEQDQNLLEQIKNQSNTVAYNLYDSQSEMYENSVDEVLNIINENNISVISTEDAENISKLIDTLLPLIKESNGNSVEKMDILKAFRNKLQTINLEEKGVHTEEVNSLNPLNFKVSKAVDEILYTLDITNKLNEDEANGLSIVNVKTIFLDELSEEDRVLNKVLGLETADNFSQVLNRLNSRNDIQTENNISSATVFKDTMDEDIVKNLRFMIRNQVQELKVKIYPKELGEMTIKILSEEGIMRAEIKATSKETYNLLNSNINEIKKSLSNENIKIQEVNIGLYNEDTTYYSGQGYREGSNNGNERYIDSDNGNIKDYEEEIEEVINTNTSNVDLFV